MRIGMVVMAEEVRSGVNVEENEERGEESYGCRDEEEEASERDCNTVLRVVVEQGRTKLVYTEFKCSYYQELRFKLFFLLAELC